MRNATQFRRHTHLPAFTLVELVLCMAIIVTLCAIAMPKYASAIASYRAKAAAHRVATDISQLQTYARTSSTTRTMTFSVASNAYQIANLRSLDTSASTYSVSLAAEPYRASIATLNFGGNATISFDGYGNPNSGGSITLQSGLSTRYVILDASTGKVTVQ